MAGSLRPTPNGAWQLRVYLGRNDQGWVIHKTTTVQGSRRQAQAEPNQMVAQYQGRLADEASPTEERVLRWGPSTTITTPSRAGS